MFVWIKVQNQYSYTLPVCIILDTEFSNVTVNNNNSNKKTHIFIKVEDECTDFQNTKPWGSALFSLNFIYSSTSGWARPGFSSSGTGRGGAGHLPPLPVVCGTPAQHGSVCWPSSIHSNTANRSRWHKRMEQIFHHSECPGIRHTSDHPAHMASLPPAPRQENNCKNVSQSC